MEKTTGKKLLRGKYMKGEKRVKKHLGNRHHKIVREGPLRWRLPTPIGEGVERCRKNGQERMRREGQGEAKRRSFQDFKALHRYAWHPRTPRYRKVETPLKCGPCDNVSRGSCCHKVPGEWPCARVPRG